MFCLEEWNASGWVEVPVTGKWQENKPLWDWRYRMDVIRMTEQKKENRQRKVSGYIATRRRHTDTKVALQGE